MAGGRTDPGRAGDGAGIRGKPEHDAAALAELERDGLLYSERTSGRFVTEDQAHILRLRDSLAGAVLREFLSRMEGLGCKREEILPLLRRELEGTGGHSGTNERKEGES